MAPDTQYLSDQHGWRSDFSYDFIDRLQESGYDLVSMRWYSPQYRQPFRIVRYEEDHFENCIYSIEWDSNYEDPIRLRNAFTGGAVFPEDEMLRSLYDRFPEEEISLDDGYSIERDETDTREFIPMLASNIGREIPLVSFEQELISGPRDIESIAIRLHEAGYGYAPYVDSYHNSAARRDRDRGRTERFCYIETDSSCGYELIFDRVNLRDRTQAEKISEVQNILKDFKAEDKIRLSARCGFHVHVDISGWGMKEIESAYHLWNYIEDPVFRLASAFWDNHRDEEVGGGYSPPIPKGYSGKSNIGLNLQNYRGSLSFIPFLAARGHCRCGAFLFEDWANCTCNLPVPTLEFRVFNATMNQRKIKAYLAFCVGFVNAAKNKEFNPIEYTPMEFRGTNRFREVPVYNNSGVQINSISWEDAAKERLDFILQEFPLTNSERADILYCAKNSSLEFIVS